MRSLIVPIGQFGALVEVEIGVVTAHRRALQRAGLSIPPSQRVLLLVDTGASHTMVDAGVMRSLGLQPSGSYPYHSSSTAGVPDRCEAYGVALTLGSAASGTAFRIDPIEVMANSFIGHHYQGLLGRDVLGRLHLSWRGPSGELSMDYP